MSFRRPLEFIWRKTQSRYARFKAFRATPLSYQFKHIGKSFGVSSLKVRSENHTLPTFLIG